MPSGPTGTRMATRDVEIGGYRVESGTMLAFGRLAVQRDPTLWEEPLIFDPDRFSPENAVGPVIEFIDHRDETTRGAAQPSAAARRCIGRRTLPVGVLPVAADRGGGVGSAGVSGGAVGPQSEHDHG